MAADASTTVISAMRVLDALAKRPEGLTVTHLATSLDLQRASLYRILRALEEYRFVRRDDTRVYRLSFGLVSLASAATGSLEAVARPILQQLADETTSTVMLLTVAGDDLVTMSSTAPSTPGMHITVPVGYVHPRSRASARVVIEAQRPAQPGDPDDVVEARRRGWARSFGLASDGLYGWAAAVDMGALGEQACLVVISREALDDDRVGAVLVTAASRLSGQLAHHAG